MVTSLGHCTVPEQAQWAGWNSEVRPYGVGVEEEVMLVDQQRRWALAQRIDDVRQEDPTIPDILRASLTWDQATEMRDWQHVSVAGETDIYFRDPHSPWQHATCESTNGPSLPRRAQYAGRSYSLQKSCADHLDVPLHMGPDHQHL